MNFIDTNSAPTPVLLLVLSTFFVPASVVLVRAKKVPVSIAVFGNVETPVIDRKSVV